MHLYSFVQAAEIWVKTESRTRGYLLTARAPGCSQREHKLDAGEQPPQNLVMVLRSAADLSKVSKPELLRSFALRGAQRKAAISAPDGDAPALLIKNQKVI